MGADIFSIGVKQVSSPGKDFSRGERKTASRIDARKENDKRRSVAGEPRDAGRAGGSFTSALDEKSVAEKASGGALKKKNPSFLKAPLDASGSEQGFCENQTLVMAPLLQATVVEEMGKGAQDSVMPEPEEAPEDSLAELGLEKPLSEISGTPSEDGAEVDSLLATLDSLKRGFPSQVGTETIGNTSSGEGADSPSNLGKGPHGSGKSHGSEPLVRVFDSPSKGVEEPVGEGLPVPEAETGSQAPPMLELSLENPESGVSEKDFPQKPATLEKEGLLEISLIDKDRPEISSALENVPLASAQGKTETPLGGQEPSVKTGLEESPKVLDVTANQENFGNSGEKGQENLQDQEGFAENLERASRTLSRENGGRKSESSFEASSDSSLSQETGASSAGKLVLRSTPLPSGAKLPESALLQRGSPMLMEGVNQTIRLVRTSRGAKAQVVVEPPALGRIEITLHTTSQGVSAVLRVDSELLRQMLQSQMSSLRSSLEQQGIAVTDLGVDVRQQNREGSFSDNPREEKGPRRIGSLLEEDAPDENLICTLDMEQGLLTWTA